MRTRELPHRRATAIGILATPARAALMLAGAAGHADRPIKATDPRLLPTARLYIAEEPITSGRGTCRIEGTGPITITMLRHLVGHCRIKATPIIRPTTPTPSTTTKSPPTCANASLLRDITDT